MQFDLFVDGDNEVIWVSEEIAHEKWPYRLLLVLQYCEKWDREWATYGRYHVSVNAVSVRASEDARIDACELVGITPLAFESMNGQAQYAVMYEAGCKAVLWQDQGDNRHKLLADAKRVANACKATFDYCMSKPQNNAGTTGWESITGNL